MICDCRQAQDWIQTIASHRIFVKAGLHQNLPFGPAGPSRGLAIGSNSAKRALTVARCFAILMRPRHRFSHPYEGDA
jgi:hypothetical protein